MLHGATTQPVNTWIGPDTFVSGVNHDNLVVFVGRVLVNPIAVQYTESSKLAPGALFCNVPQSASVLELVDTHVLWFTIADTLSDRAFASTTADTNAVYNIPLLCLISDLASLVRPGWARSAVDRRQVPILPAADPKKKSERVRLLFLIKLLHILVGTHG
jgi:hypothetical protein